MVSDKKGDVTIGTIILIVLGVVVLVFLIFGFSTGWNNLWDKIFNFGGGNTNVDTIRTACSLACSQKAVDAFCNEQREVKYSKPNGNSPATGTCKSLANNNNAKTAGLYVEDCVGLCVNS